MTDFILRIRQMMAEAKFSEAQKEVEMQLSLQDPSHQKSLLPLYLEILENLNQRLPADLIVKVCEDLVESDVEVCQKWLDKFPVFEINKNQRRLQMVKIKIAQKKGRLQELYQLISDFQLYLFEMHVPSKEPFIHELIEKYFPGDFHLKLQELALALMLNDLSSGETLINELIFSCVEKASPKGTKEKLLAIRDVLLTYRDKKQLEIYQSFCTLAAEGLQDKQDYKRLAEMVIYFDDFKFQIHILDLLFKLGLSDAIQEYVEAIKGNPQYDFLYLDKYFSHLKWIFASPKPKKTKKAVNQLPEIDIALHEPIPVSETRKNTTESIQDDEQLLISSLKYQSYTTRELIELAISFLQSEYPRAALKAADMAITCSENNQQFLKACYLKLTCLCILQDYRGALDLALEALGKAESKDDILSFLYLQAESYLHLGYKQEAKKVLKKIMSIDSHYRLTRERLERLDEI